MTAPCQSGPHSPETAETRSAPRGTLYLLVAVVAGAAGMLSFAALRDLALLCGFGRGLAWLLPVVIDAGAAAGSLVWLGERTGEPARRFARRLALGLLGLSVAANALGHGLAAYALAPPWWVVVGLSGIAPGVLGAMVHLAVLVSRTESARSPADLTALDKQADEHTDAQATSTESPPATESADGCPWDTTPPLAPPDDDERVTALIAAGVGRRRLARELGVTEHEARRLLDRTRPSIPTTPPAAQVAPSASSGALS